LSAAAGLVPQPYRVSASARETADTWTLELTPRRGERLGYEPGQFTMLYAFGAGEVPISVSGDADGGDELVQTIRAVGSVTRALCRLEPGAEVGVRGPFGRGWPLPGPGQEADIVIVAGGVGLAPLRPAIYRVLAERPRFGRATLLYGGRVPDQLLFAAELERWDRGEELDLEVTVDAAPAGWSGQVGMVPALIERLELDAERTTALVCGPEIMMTRCAEALLERGLAAERVFVSMERNMRCAVGHCGHCQWGGEFICRDGPVLAWDRVAPRIGVREL
jgi:NAD(P)H-flavin reductase